MIYMLNIMYQHQDASQRKFFEINFFFDVINSLLKYTFRVDLEQSCDLCPVTAFCCNFQTFFFQSSRKVI